MDPKLEATFVRSFVRPQRQERALFLLNSKKKRDEFLWQIDSYLDKSFFEQYRVAWYREMYDILRKNGAPDTCYLMSRCSSFDGIYVSLADAFRDEGTYSCIDLFICIPDKLVYYPDEDYRKFLLKR